MEIKNKLDYIDAGINISNLVRTTLGIRGMNKMIVSKDKLIMTNDGATIIKSVDFDNPIMQIFKELANSQEQKIGDGTTTTVLFAGQLLEKSKELMNKGIHKTTIINGFNIARNECLRFLMNNNYLGHVPSIIKTTFGSKINKEMTEILTNILLKPHKELKICQIENSNPNLTNIMKGYAFEGFTQNDRMPNYINGNICVLDTRNNIEFTKFQITNSDELKKITELEKEHKKSIINKLMESNIKCVFYSDTNPEFESMLTEKGIMGIVVYKREILDNICKSLNIQSSVEDLHIGTGIVEYKDYIKIFSENSQIDTLLLHGSTRQVLEETSRAIDDVIRLLKVDNKSVTGAGAIEIELSLHLEKLSKEIGGKEQLAILKFAEALESIPMIIAENCGLDSIEIVTLLKTLHSNGKKDFGIDLINGVSDAKERNIIEPIELKMHAISSSTDVANLIIKLDDVYKG